MLTKILAVIAALVLAGLLSVIGVQRAGLTEATERAVAAQTQAEQYQRSLRSLEAVRGAEKKAANSSAQALHNRAAAAEKAAKAAQKESKALREALQDNRDWADSPIPDSVRNGITQGG
jgi:uncharacterized protein HemX